MKYIFSKKSSLLLITFLILVSFASCQESNSDQSTISSQTQSAFSTSSSNESFAYESQSQTTSSETASEETNIEITDWKLILVNIWNNLPENFEVELNSIGARKMDSRIISATKQMISDAKNDGIDLLLASSHRSVERQTELFNQQIQKYKNLGYSDDDAYTEAKAWVAVPGTSEHHTGLALDIVTPTYQVLDYGFDTTDAFKWLYEHCDDYGFILRYPKTKSDITGITYEPWHYRYVGTEAAKYIMENGLCLEEYIEEISE